MSITLDQLRAIMPGISQPRAEQYLPYLNTAMDLYAINTPLRQAAFLAQLAHESHSLQWMTELASGAEYEGRHDLGNTHPGDGVRFKGRGPIQLTGRANYRAAGQALGVDLENNPQWAAWPEYAFRTAGWYWHSHDLNVLADERNFDQITHKINGGWNGKAEREAFYKRALIVLGVE